MRPILDAAGPSLPGDVAGAGADGLADGRRSRNSGIAMIGCLITRSVISGRADHRLANDMIASMRPMAMRWPPSNPPPPAGEGTDRVSDVSSVTSFIATLSEGKKPILVEPAIVARYPVSRAIRPSMVEFKKPAGIPVIRNST